MGIKQLLEAEQKAQEMVNKARKGNDPDRLQSFGVIYLLTILCDP